VTGFWIGYVVFVIVLLIMREVIDDGARDRTLAYLFCLVIVIVAVVFWAIGRLLHGVLP